MISVIQASLMLTLSSVQQVESLFVNGLSNIRIFVRKFQQNTTVVGLPFQSSILNIDLKEN